MPGQPRVLLHVGSPKTGTTFIQQILWAERERALSQGVHLPLKNFHEHFWASLDVRDRGGKPPHPPQSAGAWDRLVKESMALDGTVLVSHELFAAANATQAKRAVGWFGSGADVHVVITARDLVRQLTAEWQEHVKHRSSLTLEQFVDDVRTRADDRSGWFWLVQDTASLAARWGSQIPAAKVHVVTVPEAGASSDLLWERFAGLVGLDAGSFDTAAARSNTSLGVEQTELLRLTNAALGDRLPMPGPYPAVGKEVLAHRILAARSGAKLRLRPDDAAFMAQESRRVAETLEAAGVDVVGSLEELVPGEATLAAVSDPDAYAVPSDADLLDEGVAALADLLCVLSEREAALAELRDKVDSMVRNPVKAALDVAAEGRPGLARMREAYTRSKRR